MIRNTPLNGSCKECLPVIPSTRDGFESRPDRKARQTDGLLSFVSFSVYILESLADGSFYIGYSQDPTERLEVHNNGGSRYTAKKIPWKLVYTETFQTKTEALKREKFLKKQRNKDFYRRLIGDSGQSIERKV